MKKLRIFCLLLAACLLTLTACGVQPPMEAMVPYTELKLTNVTDQGCDLYQKDIWVGGVFQVAMEPDQVQVHGLEDEQWFSLLRTPMQDMVSGDYDFMAESSLYPTTVNVSFYHPDHGEYSHYVFVWEDRVFDFWTRPDALTDAEESQVMDYILDHRP